MPGTQIEFALERQHTWGLDLSGSMQGAGGVGGLLSTEIYFGDGLGKYYPTYDGNGNVSEYLDANGIWVAHYEYDPFGNVIEAVGTKSESFRYRFSTKPQDVETGLYYYGYRYYDPTTGRWPSRDPIEENGGLNLYGMVGNDPVGRIDFLGLAWPKSCEEMCQKQKQMFDRLKHLAKRIGRFLGVKNPDSHWDTIEDQCNALDKALDAIDACCCLDENANEMKDIFKEEMLKQKTRCGRVGHLHFRC